MTRVVARVVVSSDFGGLGQWGRRTMMTSDGIKFTVLQSVLRSAR